MILLKRATRLTCLFCLLIPITLVAQHDLELHTERGNISNDGRIKLIWNSAGNEATYELQSASDTSFNNAKTLYQGPDRASFVSGLRNGTYYFRVRTIESKWSNTLVVEVRHHALKLALILFGVGGIVFILTVAVVIEGMVRTKKSTV